VPRQPTFALFTTTGAPCHKTFVFETIEHPRKGSARPEVRLRTAWPMPCGSLTPISGDRWLSQSPDAERQAPAFPRDGAKRAW